MTFDRARRGLLDELRKLGARDVILSTNVELRLDGNLRANRGTNVQDPGVAVYFTRANGQRMAMARDAYATVASNMRSLAIAIDHLRGLERHGGATMMERAFTGFTALAEPGRKRTWREVMRFEPGAIEQMHPTARWTFVRQQFLMLCHTCHPDHGGSTEAMAELNAAWGQAKAELGKA